MKYAYGNTYYGENKSYTELGKKTEEDKVFHDAGTRPPEHYYGDITRKLLIAAGILMLVATPFLSEYLPRPLIIPVLAAVILAFVAGFTSPNQKTVAIANLAVSALALMAFETYAIYMFMENQSVSQIFFIVSQTLAIIFFIDVYYGAKTVRGMFMDSFSNREKIEKTLLKYGKKTEDLKDIFWEAVAGGGSEEAASYIITDADRLDRYLSLRKSGASNCGAVDAVKKSLCIS